MKDGNIVFQINDRLIMNTSLTQSAFTKSRITERLGEEGFLAVRNDSLSWTFSPWRFTATKLFSTIGVQEFETDHSVIDTVVLEGKCFDGSTLMDLFEQQKKSDCTEERKAYVTEAAAAVCSAIENAISNGIKLSNVGAGGIFVSSDLTQFIFMPQDLFETSAACRGDNEYSLLHGIYVYKTLTGNSALRFTEAVIAYRALCGEFPFALLNSEKRSEDYIDHNFIHIENRIYALDEKLSFFINNALLRTAKIATHTTKKHNFKRSLSDRIIAGVTDGITNNHSIDEKRKLMLAGMKMPLETLYKELGLNENGRVPSTAKLNKPVREGKVSYEIFSKNTNKQRTTFNQKLKIKRWFRKHSTTLTVTGCIILGLAILVFSFWKDTQKNTTSKSLTSSQTVEMFYSAMNNLDVSSAQASSSGKNTNGTVDLITNFYVSTKTRSSYEPQFSCVAPASWIVYNNKLMYTMFGLTQFSINGVQGKLNYIGPEKRTKPRILSEENGNAVGNGMQTSYNIHYNLVYSEAEELHVIEHNDVITLTFKKDKWVVTEIQKNEKEELVNTADFITDYSNLKESLDNKPLEIRNSLKQKYNWISTEEEIVEAEKKIQDSINF